MWRKPDFEAGKVDENSDGKFRYKIAFYEKKSEKITFKTLNSPVNCVEDRVLSTNKLLCIK